MKHSHYHKNVSGLQSIDVYRVLRLFEVTDPCLQHAIKKLLVAGNRGAKDIAQDVQEAIDTLERWKEMSAEDWKPIVNVEAIKPELDSLESAPFPFKTFDEYRMDIIGQNGNDGLHYGQCLSCKRETCQCEG